MMFENDVAPEPSTRSQFFAHLPIALLVAGLLGAFVALHMAVAGIVIAALAHAAIGLLLLAVRRHRAGATSGGHS